MILYGQYDSPFTRRVAVALEHYRAPFERRALSVFDDFDAMLVVNPLGKVPALELDNGELLFDSRAIIEYLESVAPEERLLTPGDDTLRRAVLRIEAVAIGLAEKVYERGVEAVRKAPATRDAGWIARLERQVGSALAWLETAAGDGWLVGGVLTRADLALATATTYFRHKRPDFLDLEAFVKIEAHRIRCEALPIFAAAPHPADKAAIAAGQPTNR